MLRPRFESAIAAALDYAAAGSAVFLLGRSKRPVGNCPPCRAADPARHDRETCPCLTCHGFYAATRDHDRIAAMFEVVADGLLAIRTGAASGRVVIDIDPGHGGAIDRAVMAPTATVATGGGGWHLHYRHPGGTVPSRPLPGHRGVDVKADGGYVVAPPSAHPATRRPYRWIGVRPVNEMPPALRALCLAPSAPEPGPRPGRTAPGIAPELRRAGGISSPAALLAAHLDAVARAPEGRRRTTLYGAARGVARMVAVGAIAPADARRALTAAGEAAQQTDREIRAAIAGGFTAEGVNP